MKGIIYCLVCVKTSTPFYIGCTTVSIESRFTSHKALAKCSNAKVYKHIRDNNIEFKIKELQVISFLDKKDLLNAELKWVKEFSNNGVNLMNTHKMLPNSKVSDNKHGQNIRVPLDDFYMIKSYVDDHNYKLGGFLAAAAIEKIARETKNKP
jgi:hypothetical protein